MKDARRKQEFEAFKEAWKSYPSQDNEGYVPDRGGFKCGWFAALEWADSHPDTSDGDEEANKPTATRNRAEFKTSTRLILSGIPCRSEAQTL